MNMIRPMWYESHIMFSQKFKILHVPGEYFRRNFYAKVSSQSFKLSCQKFLETFAWNFDESFVAATLIPVLYELPYFFRANTFFIWVWGASIYQMYFNMLHEYLYYELAVKTQTCIVLHKFLRTVCQESRQEYCFAPMFYSLLLNLLRSTSAIIMKPNFQILLTWVTTHEVWLNNVQYQAKVITLTQGHGPQAM